MAPKFGTSGLRGLVTDLTPECVARYVAAFVAACPVGRGIYIGHDLRASSPMIAEHVARAAVARGVDVFACGPVPTPGLALASMQAGAAAVMVTGSHIPADRNGLKFYTPGGEITKADEALILQSLDGAQPTGAGTVQDVTSVADAYLARYRSAYAGALAGRRIGLYMHSAVGRDLMQTLLTDLGAEVVPLGRSDQFIPVDTEAVSDDLRAQCVDWAGQHGCDAVLSTDADGDRPLLTDEAGVVVPGDILGQITAKALGAEVVVTPISSNTGVAQMDVFQEVIRTRIGSPFVIAGMEAAAGKTVGYEANGGFLLGFEAHGPRGVLPPLMTRDALLPILSVLAAAQGRPLSELVAEQPARFTAADRLQEVPTDISQAFVRRLASDAAARADFLAPFGGVEVDVNTLDGLRITLNSGRILHLRPSGNAPELRLYVEAESPAIATDLLDQGLRLLREAVSA